MFSRCDSSRTRRGALVAGLAAVCAAGGSADVFVPLASYEPQESDLVVYANSGDPGLATAIVPGGVAGAPPATDGAYVVQLTITGEADRKVEFRHRWNSTWYDLAGAAELLADVYVADASARPGVLGVWSANWSPPSPWQPAAALPATVGAWQTVAFPIAGRTQNDNDYLWAIVFENLAGTSGTIYVDNLRLRRTGAPPAPTGVGANGYADHNDVLWKPARLQQLDGYHVYRSAQSAGPYDRLTTAPIAEARFRDDSAPAGAVRWYCVSAVVAGVESALSTPTSARFNGLSDDELLTEVQEAAFQYFWTGGHPFCGMAREGIGFGHPGDSVTIGGTGFGLMTLVVGAERGFVARNLIAARVLRILRFLDGVDPDDPGLSSGVQRYHGAWAHHYNGVSGATIPFSGPDDNGGDLVETGFLVEGLLTVRQYFDGPDAIETEIRARATSMWEGVEWDWYRRFPGSNVLYWHWSPTAGWTLNLQIRGFNETQIIYLLAIASPTHPMPAASYYDGWAGNASYTINQTYFGHHLEVGWTLGGPLFFTHYSNLGWDPRYLGDAFTNYFKNARTISLIHHDYCVDNRFDFTGYGPLLWGITPSADPTGYVAHEPRIDNGVISPTAAVCALPYTPDESLATIRHMYDRYGAQLWGPYGFYDAFRPTSGWVGAGYLAIDQGPMCPMIENYRSGLCWRLFMSNPEIKPALRAIGFRYEVDADGDGDVDGDDLAEFGAALAGPDIDVPPEGVSPAWFASADLDGDGDVDLHDAQIMQTLGGGL